MDCDLSVLSCHRFPVDDTSVLTWKRHFPRAAVRDFDGNAHRSSEEVRCPASPIHLPRLMISKNCLAQSHCYRIFCDFCWKFRKSGVFSNARILVPQLAPFASFARLPLGHISNELPFTIPALLTPLYFASYDSRIVYRPHSEEFASTQRVQPT